MLYVGGNYNQNQNNGLFYRNGNNTASNANANIGSRHHVIEASPPKHRQSRTEQVKILSKGHGIVHSFLTMSDGNAMRQTWRNMKRKGNLFEGLVSDENLYLAIQEVNKSHHYVGKGNSRRVNQTTLWVERTKSERVEELRRIITDGYEASPTRKFRVYDSNAQKWRDINEPAQYPDQYIHHAVQQCLEPIMMKGMDPYCCGSIKHRGSALGIRAIKRWMKTDKAGTKYAMECDIRHYYESIDPMVAFAWFKRHVKDRKVLDIVWAIIKDGITIGGFFSQWTANSILQPIDQKIRQSGLCSHYVRYIDNFTIFGSNKRNMKRLLGLLEQWLGEMGLTLKPNKQIYRVDERMSSALGYRFDHNKIYLRKRNLLRLRRKVRRIQRKKEAGVAICYAEAASVLSQLGQLRHCDSYHLRHSLYRKGFVTQMKNIIRLHTRREARESWKNTLTQTVCFA